MHKSILTTLLALGASGLLGRAELPYRTDTNPALLYWQAFLQLPHLSDQETALLKNSRSYPLDKKYEELGSRYGFTMRLLRQATRLKSPCDWGIDLADGPETLLPHLAKAKGVATAARFRTRYFLEQGQESEAVQDLVGSFVLARHLAGDGTLISVLVQIAMENIVVATVAENYYAFSTPALQRILAGIDAAPARYTVSRSIGTGERCMGSWFTAKIADIRAQYPGDDAKVISAIRELLAGTMTDQQDYKQADAYIAAGGGTSEGLLALMKATEPFYNEMQALAALPYASFDAANNAFFAKVEISTNPFVRSLFPALNKARVKEFAAQAYLDMLRATVKYRLEGTDGLKKVNDPFGAGPFAFRRFVFEDEDRGFELKSNLVAENPVVLIIVEKKGPYFQVQGRTAGKPLGDN